MLDFYQIVAQVDEKKGKVNIYPEFKVKRSQDLMVRGKSFYAIWDEERQFWSTDEYDVQRFVDSSLWDYESETPGFDVTRKLMANFSSNAWMQFRNYCKNVSDAYHQLDEQLTFANSEVKKNDYVSRALSYSLAQGDISAWDELIGTLYDSEERAKIEWALGAIISGDAKNIQKFLVLYGPGGTGKSTLLNIVQKLFAGYYALFEAKALTGNNNQFALEAFKNNPLVAIQHDGDLSKIEDNTRLNSVISHEEMVINEKFKSQYAIQVVAFLLMGTNKPVKITDAKSGIIRRLIDVKPTGEKIPPRKYQALMSQIDFELGAIAHHCLEVYREMGKDYYSGYQPTEMMLQTDVFFNFIEANFDIFESQDGATLKQAYTLYKEYCDEALVDFKLPMYKFRDELRNYFSEFVESFKTDDGDILRSYYKGFIADKFKSKKPDERAFSLVMDETTSIFDEIFAEQPAQYAKDDGTPEKKWQYVRTTLKDLDTTREHYVKIPSNYIVVDFDLKDGDGKKSAERNLEAASRFPATNGEFSKSGAGVHLLYAYTGQVDELSRIYDEGIEIKVFTGDSALRRKMSRCNNVPIAQLSVGALPLKEKKVINEQQVKSEKALRDLVTRNLKKEIHPGTKSSVDFIRKVLDDAYESDLSYDLSNMRPAILAFANGSTNHALYCIKQVQEMKFMSANNQNEVVYAEDNLKVMAPKDDRIVFFDVEVFQNLFIVCWKFKGSDTVVRMINPKASDIEGILSLKLVGFFNRRYDNHILYAAYMGYNNMELYKLSQRIVNGSPNAMFREAYNISYTDIWDFANKKQSLKKWEIELGLNHMESELPWDQPVPPEKWKQVEEYCANDVIATEATFDSREADWIARQILAAQSGLSLNNTTQQHTAKIVFGDDPRPQQKFVYTDLSRDFPGYTFEMGKSSYRGENPSEGGYVYSEPGIYEDVALLDIQSMHPTSIKELNLFGPYTEKYVALMQARLAVKRGDKEKVKELLGTEIAQYMNDEKSIAALSYALKIPINIVYGLTSAGFDNMFRDPKNIDNIVAKRGALFMIELKHFVQELGYTVAHIKTDSIKIPNATPEIIAKIMEFGQRYGYTFEHEATYAKFCLVNDAVYVAKTEPHGDTEAYWTATGAQFQHPYVFKTLFTHELVTFEDFCETKTVTGESAMYLDFSDGNEPMAFYKEKRHFVGRAGQFTPVEHGGTLYRVKDGKDYAVSGTKGYKWLESEMVSKLKLTDDIDMRYFHKLANDAIDTISKYGNYEEFVND